MYICLRIYIFKRTIFCICYPRLLYNTFQVSLLCTFYADVPINLASPYCNRLTIELLHMYFIYTTRVPNSTDSQLFMFIVYLQLCLYLATHKFGILLSLSYAFILYLRLKLITYYTTNVQCTLTDDNCQTCTPVAIFCPGPHDSQWVISTCGGFTVIKLFYPQHPHFDKNVPPPPHDKSWNSPKIIMIIFKVVLFMNII